MVSDSRKYETVLRTKSAFENFTVSSSTVLLITWVYRKNISLIRNKHCVWSCYVCKIEEHDDALSNAVYMMQI